MEENSFLHLFLQFIISKYAQLEVIFMLQVLIHNLQTH